MGFDGLRRRFCLSAILPALVTVVLAMPAAAFQFSLGEVDGSLDSTLSFGMSWRVSEQDNDIIGKANGGRAYSVNGDDGNLNYADNELASQVAKITTDLELRWENFGLFVRGSAFHDFENYGRSRERTELTDEAEDLVGRDAYLLDNYLWWDFDIGDALGQFRVGDQVLSWGESTFIQNSINTINPIDVNKFRLPGSELKEALVPVGMVSGSIAPNEYISFEGFYQYDWEKTEIDPPGTYWSTNDFVGDGGQKVMLGFGDAPDQGNLPAELTFLGVPRGKDRKPGDDGQYGIAVRVYAPGLNNTEFGFYYINYHSRLPIISAQTGTLDGALGAQSLPAIAQTNIIPAVATALGAGATTDQAILAGIGAGVANGTTVPQAAVISQAVATGGDVPNAIKSSATDAYAKTARYIIEYPEDIQLLGVSFNTQLDSIGASLQGEYSYRKDVPLQVDDVELLLAALTPLNDPNTNILSDNQLGVYGLNTYISGYEELDVSQVQMTMTKLFGPTFGADQFTLVGEAGWTHVHSMPGKDKLRLESPGTYTSGNPNQADDPRGAHYLKDAEPSGAFADQDSWGYRVVAKLDFNNAIGAITLSPRIAFAHDVDGNTPGPGGNFLEDRKAITFGMGADYQKTWSADVSYTDFFGAGRYNLVNDRDLLALNIKYSF